MHLPPHLAFPDFSRVHIRRPAPDLKSWQDRAIDFTPVIESGNCPDDVSLEWGDVVLIPEADHALSAELAGILNKRTGQSEEMPFRQVIVIVKVNASQITLAPEIMFPGDTKYPVPNATFVGGPPSIRTRGTPSG